jgi:hypothetical protein
MPMPPGRRLGTVPGVPMGSRPGQNNIISYSMDLLEFKLL